MSVHKFPGQDDAPDTTGLPKKPQAGDGMTMLQLQEELAYFQTVAADQSDTSANLMGEVQRLNTDMNRLGEYLRTNYADEINRQQYPHQGANTGVDAALYYMAIERRRFGVRFKKLWAKIMKTAD